MRREEKKERPTWILSPFKKENEHNVGGNICITWSWYRGELTHKMELGLMVTHTMRPCERTYVYCPCRCYVLLIVRL